MIHKKGPTNPLVAALSSTADAGVTANTMLGRPATQKIRRVGDATITTRTIELSDVARSRTGITTLVKEQVAEAPPVLEGFFVTSLGKKEGCVTIAGQITCDNPLHYFINARGETSGSMRRSSWTLDLTEVTVSADSDPAPYKNSSIVFLSGSGKNMYLSVYSPKSSGQDGKLGYVTSDPLPIQPDWVSVNFDTGQILWGGECCSDLVYRGPLKYADGTRAVMYSFVGKYGSQIAVFTCVLYQGYPYSHEYSMQMFTQSIGAYGPDWSQSSPAVVFTSVLDAYIAEATELSCQVTGSSAAYATNQYISVTANAGRLGRLAGGAYSEMTTIKDFWAGEVERNYPVRVLEGGAVVFAEHDGGAFAMLGTHLADGYRSSSYYWYADSAHVDNGPYFFSCYAGKFTRVLWLHGGVTTILDDVDTITDTTEPSAGNSAYNTADMYNTPYVFGAVSLFDRGAEGCGAVLALQDRFTTDIHLYYVVTTNGSANVVSSVTIGFWSVSPHANIWGYESARIRMAVTKPFKKNGVLTYRVIFLGQAARYYRTVDVTESGVFTDAASYATAITDVDDIYAGLTSIQDRNWQDTYMWKKNHPPFNV